MGLWTQWKTVFYALYLFAVWDSMIEHMFHFFYLLWITIDTFWKTTLGLKSLYCSKKAVKCHSFEYLTMRGFIYIFQNFPFSLKELQPFCCIRFKYHYLMLFKKFGSFQISLISGNTTIYKCGRKQFVLQTRKVATFPSHCSALAAVSMQ